MSFSFPKSLREEVLRAFRHSDHLMRTANPVILRVICLVIIMQIVSGTALADLHYISSSLSVIPGPTSGAKWSRVAEEIEFRPARCNSTRIRAFPSPSVRRDDVSFLGASRDGWSRRFALPGISSSNSQANAGVSLLRLSARRDEHDERRRFGRKTETSPCPSLHSTRV